MNYGGLFDPEAKEIRISELEEKMQQANFWDNKKESEAVINELNLLKSQLYRVEELKTKVTSNLEILESLKSEDDAEMHAFIEEEEKETRKSLEQCEVELLLSGTYDGLGAILELHSGAGGTEACDWNNMLYRMYTRWCEKKQYKVEVIDEQPGDEAGFKSVTMLVKGAYAYGYLKCEKGVHRLVRISPFDSGARRHTSFASLNVTPLFEDKNIDIEMKESDLRIDVYRSSGCGGQGVNTTDSAVRITHLPTKIVVTCQNERSQIQNKEKAMEVLKNKLYQLELEKKERELKNITGDVMDINFGSQIRSYVMHPYSLVKDHRTNTETAQVTRVLDGDIDLFINDNLRKGSL